VKTARKLTLRGAVEDWMADGHLFSGEAVRVIADSEGKYAVLRSNLTFEQIGPMYATKAIAAAAFLKARRAWDRAEEKRERAGLRASIDLAPSSRRSG
jgi:hypothetical protein